MKAMKKGNTLVIESGFLRPTYEIQLDEILSWEFVVEDNGATYFAFNLKGFIQHVSVPKMKPQKLYDLISCIEYTTDLKATLKISERLLAIKELLSIAEVTIDLLVLILIFR